jgi:hypothetical protein
VRDALDQDDELAHLTPDDLEPEPAPQPARRHRAGLAGLVYITTDGRVNEDQPLPVEVVADQPAGIPDHDPTNSSGVPVRAIVSTSMDTPLSPHERASIARLFEAAVEALGDERATHARNAQAFNGHLRWVADRAALAVRQGHRAHLLDQLTAGLDTFVASLSEPGKVE